MWLSYLDVDGRGSAAAGAGTAEGSIFVGAAAEDFCAADGSAGGFVTGATCACDNLRRSSAAAAASSFLIN